MKLSLLSLVLVSSVVALGCDHVARPATIASLDLPAHGAPRASDHRAAWRAYLSSQRELQIQRLRAYAEKGEFALNDKGAPGLQFIWKDTAGRLCAMAHLVGASGRADLVEAVAKEHNDLQLATVKDGPMLEWMLASGLTQEEIQLVQEPGFQLEERSLVQWEVQRKRQHIAAAVELLRQQAQGSLDKAVARLGERAQRPPPA